MNPEPSLPKDPTAAAELLAALVEKDKEEQFCSYPTCYEMRQVTNGAGRPSAYCDNPKHTAVTNHRARQLLQKSARGIPDAPSKRERVVFPAGMNVESLRGSVITEMQQLGVNLERYVAILAEISDPDIATAQLQATQDRADARIAEMQQSLSAERSLRLAAEATSMAARNAAGAEREAAEQAISAMEEAEAKMVRIGEATTQQLLEMQTERDAAIERIHLEAQRQKEQIEAQAKEAIDHAQAAMEMAKEEARFAEAHAHEVEAGARTKIAAAEHLVSEARATLERERSEVDRLRTELTGVRQQAEAERRDARLVQERLGSELAEVRQQIDTERRDARAVLERERTEVDRLRTELANARVQTEQGTKRADQLTILIDTLRAQLVEVQATKKGETPQQDMKQ